jgi:hypothetical protein
MFLGSQLSGLGYVNIWSAKHSLRSVFNAILRLSLLRWRGARVGIEAVVNIIWDIIYVGRRDRKAGLGRCDKFRNLT